MDHSVNLEPKIQPRQKRAKATYERLLDVAARLLEEEGVERISTNMIAEHAGVTVPALYRYFPNKYAVLRALGDRLMERQNEVAMAWLSEQGEPDPVGLFESAEDFMLRTITVTVEQPGGLAIMRALRAVPTLQDVRLASHRQVTDLIVEYLATITPMESREKAWKQARFSVEMGYAAVEMALEEDRLSYEDIVKEASHQLRAYWAPWLEKFRKDSDN